MPSQEPNFIWEEDQDGLRVHFPPPPAEIGSMGCAVALFAFALLVAAIFLIIVFAQFIDGLPTDPLRWIIIAGILAGTILILRYAFATVKQSRIPPALVEPSALVVSGGELKIERTGRERDVDVSWERTEIADIRLCAAVPELNYFRFKSLWKQVIFAEDVVRVSVMVPSGEVEDVYIKTSGKYWIRELETKLRAYLGLQS